MGEVAETSTVEIAPLEQKIIQQVEYYFGDLNLPKDKFLQGEIKKDNGWVTLETMLKFNRLKNLSTDPAFIANAMRKSNSGIIEVDAEGKKLRRAKPLPENTLEFWQEVKSRTVYVKGFPQTATLDELQEFFKKFNEVERVQMRYYKANEQRNFKGSVFVTFKSADDAKKFVNLETVKYGEDELLRLSQMDYFKKKTEDSKRRRDEKKGTKDKNGVKEKDEKEEKEEEEEEESVTKGRVLRLTGIPKQGVGIDAIKTLFGEHQRPEWVDYNKGDEEAFVRFEDKPNSAEDILKRTLESKGGKLALGETEIQAEVVTGDAEDQYWERTLKAKNEAIERKARGRGGRGRGRGRGRGGRGGGRGRRGGPRTRGQAAAAEEAQNKIRFSSSSESEPEEKAAKEFRNAKRAAADSGKGEPTKKAKVE